MSGKMKKKSLFNTLRTKLQKQLKTELRAVFLTSDKKTFLNQNQALAHEEVLDKQKEEDRRREMMKEKIAEIVCQIIEEKQWGLFFKNEPIQALPIQDDTKLYKINEVKRDELIDAITGEIEERVAEWQDQQIPKQTDNKLSNGSKTISDDTKE